MSHNPPPYYPGYPPPHPPAPGIAYVPAPVMMPMYPPQPEPVQPPQPTYVTNIYHQPEQPQPQPQLQPQPMYVEADIDWVEVTPTTYRRHEVRALVAGKEGWDGSPLWVIRAHHSGDFIPGKLAAKHGSAYVAHAGKEVPVHNFEVLLAKPHAVRWLPGNDGQVPVGAIPAGNTHSGEPLYIARARHMNSLTPGKVHPSHGCAYISFGGKEIRYKQYEVLCKVVG